MADRVENVMEHMLPEFNFYTKEDLFSKQEIRKIVKERRGFEYQMHRKDADVSFFIKAIQFERELNKKKMIRKKNQKEKVKFDF